MSLKKMLIFCFDFAIFIAFNKSSIHAYSLSEIISMFQIFQASCVSSFFLIQYAFASLQILRL